MAEATKKPNIFQKLGKYFKDIRAEGKKVVWPTRSQLINNTLVVIAAVLIVGAFIWICDALLQLVVSSALG